MNRLFLAAVCLVVWHVTPASARTLVFLGKGVETWRKQLDSPDAKARHSAAFALGRMGADARSAVPDLVRRLRDKESSVREMAASALGDIARDLKGGKETVWQASGGWLVKMLESDQSDRVRRSAAYALGAFGPQAAGATPTLSKALRDDKPSVRQNAAWALGQIGPLAGDSVDALRACLQDADALVRRDAAGAFGSMGKAGASAGNDLIRLVKDEKDNVVKKSALDSLSHIAGPEQADAAKELAPLLEEKDPEIRFASALVLARIGGESASLALPVLQAGLKDADNNNRELVAAALSNIGPAAKPAMYALADALSDESNPVGVRRNAALAIAHIGAEAEPVVPTVVKALQRTQPAEVRKYAAEALAQIQYPANEKAIPAILDAIANDTEADVRQKCVWALFRLTDADKFRALGADKALEKLLDVGGTKMALVRYDAARKLAQVLTSDAPDKTADVLLEMYNNKTLLVYKGTDAQVEGAGNEAAAGKANVKENKGGDARYMAVQAMGWLGDKAKKRADVMQAIREAAKDDDAQLRKTAEKALKALDG
jgi:HEAT repeat protein